MDLELIEEYGLTRDEVEADETYTCPNCGQVWGTGPVVATCAGHGGDLCPECESQCCVCAKPFCDVCLVGQDDSGRLCRECATLAEADSRECAIHDFDENHQCRGCGARAE